MEWTPSLQGMGMELPHPIHVRFRIQPIDKTVFTTIYICHRPYTQLEVRLAICTLQMNLLNLHENVPTDKVLLCLGTIYRYINVMVPRYIKYSLDHNCFQIYQTRPMDGKVSEPQHVRTREAPSYTHYHVICSITNECKLN